MVSEVHYEIEAINSKEKIISNSPLKPTEDFASQKY